MQEDQSNAKERKKNDSNQASGTEKSEGSTQDQNPPPKTQKDKKPLSTQWRLKFDIIFLLLSLTYSLLLNSTLNHKNQRFRRGRNTPVALTLVLLTFLTLDMFFLIFESFEPKSKIFLINFEKFSSNSNISILSNLVGNGFILFFAYNQKLLPALSLISSIFLVFKIWSKLKKYREVGILGL